MEVFGSFEADDIAREGNFGVVMYARRAGTKERRFAVKVFRPPELMMDEDQIVAESELFLEAAEAQKRAHAIAGAAWGPVYESGKCQGGAWYATDLMQCSLEMLRITQKDLEPEHIRRVVESIVQGLLSLRGSMGRPHGNLRETNVLVSGREDLSRARIVLCDPKPTSRCRGIEDEQRDARDLGNLVHQLVLHRPFLNPLDHPIQSSERWERMGKAGSQWLELMNRLLDPKTAAKPGLDEIAASIPGPPLKPAKKGPDPAEAERAAKEEAARQEESKRKQREAQIAAQVEAEKKKREEREQAERERQERDRKERERAEKERQEKEKAEKERLEKERVERERIAREKKEAEEERRKAEQEAREKAAREKKEREAKEAAERKAEAERVQKLKAEQAEAQRAAAEKQRQEAEARKAQEAAERDRERAARAAAKSEAAAKAEAPAAAVPAQTETPRAPRVEPEPSRTSATKPGGNKGVMIAVGAAALVAVAGGGYFLLGGNKGDTNGDKGPPIAVNPTDGKEKPTVEPGPNDGQAGSGKDRPQSPVAPTLAELQEAARTLVPADADVDRELSGAVAERLAQASGGLAETLRRAAVDQAGKLPLETTNDRVNESVAAAVRTAIGEVLGSAAGSAPTVAERPRLAALAQDVSGKLKSGKPAAAASDLENASRGTIETAVARRWKAVADAAVKAKTEELFASLGGPAVAAGMDAFRARAGDKPVTPTDTQTNPSNEPTQADLDSLINTANQIGSSLNSGAAGGDYGRAASEAFDRLKSQKWFDRVASNGGVRLISDRIAFLRAVETSDAADVIARGRAAAGTTGGVAEMLAVWNRIGSIESPIDLGQLATVRDATTRRTENLNDPAVRQQLDNAVKVACDSAWTRAASGAKTDTSIDAVRAQQKALGVPDDLVQKAPVIAFNFALRDLKREMGAGSAEQPSTDSLKAAAQKFLDRVGPMQSALSGQGFADAVALARQIVDAKPTEAGPGDLARAGPGSMPNWTAQVDAGGQRVTYVLAAAGPQAPEERLAFSRVGQAYLSETEVPLSLFRRIANERGVYQDIAGNCRDSPSGLKVWTLAGGAVTRAAGLVNNQVIGGAAAQWSGRPARELAPQLDWPVQWVGPRAAMVIAGRMGCRLPTAQEFQEASQANAAGNENLRDETFSGVLTAAKAFPRNPIFPDDGAIVEQRANATDFRPSDGVAFFAPVSAGTGTWKFLRGNVAEWVITSAPPAGNFPTTLASVDAGLTFGAAGGSALGPPENADRVVPPTGRNPVYSDVGFRLAFPAPGASASGPVDVTAQVTSLLGSNYQ